MELFLYNGGVLLMGGFFLGWYEVSLRLVYEVISWVVAINKK